MAASKDRSDKGVDSPTNLSRRRIISAGLFGAGMVLADQLGLAASIAPATQPSAGPLPGQPQSGPGRSAQQSLKMNFKTRNYKHEIRFDTSP